MDDVYSSRFCYLLMYGGLGSSHEVSADGIMPGGAL